MTELRLLGPEGGDLVAGLPNRVYFQARTTLGKPADLKGRVLEDGPKARLLNSETLTRAFGLPIEVGERNGYFHAW